MSTILIDKVCLVIAGLADVDRFKGVIQFAVGSALLQEIRIIWMDFYNGSL